MAWTVERGAGWNLQPGLQSGLKVSLAVGVILCGLACSSNHGAADGAVDLDAKESATSDGPAADGSGDVRCTVAIDQIECAPTLSGQRAQDRFCRATHPSCESQIGPCGNYQVYWVNFGLGILLCIYDGAGTSLLSATSCSDVDGFCEETSLCGSGGADIDINASCNLAGLPHPTPPPRDGGEVADGGESG